MPLWIGCIEPGAVPVHVDEYRNEVPGSAQAPYLTTKMVEGGLPMPAAYARWGATSGCCCSAEHRKDQIEWAVNIDAASDYGTNDGLLDVGCVILYKRNTVEVGWFVVGGCGGSEKIIWNAVISEGRSTGFKRWSNFSRRSDTSETQKTKQNGIHQS